MWKDKEQAYLCIQEACVHLRTCTYAYFELLPFSCLSDPLAFVNIVGKEEDAEKEEDMKTSKMNEKEAQTVVSAALSYLLKIEYISLLLL